MVLISIAVYDFISLFTLKFQTLKTVFHWLSKHLELRQKYSAQHHIFNFILGDGYSNETLSLALIYYIPNGDFSQSLFSIQ